MAINHQTEENGAWNGLLAITAPSHVVVSHCIALISKLVNLFKCANTANDKGWEVHLTFDHPVDSIESPLATVS